jgi:hypothetical protein
LCQVSCRQKKQATRCNRQRQHTDSGKYKHKTLQSLPQMQLQPGAPEHHFGIDPTRFLRANAGALQLRS